MPKETVKQRRQRKGEAELHELLALARERTPNDLRVARSAIKDALKLSTSMRLRIPLEEKRKICKHCFTYLKSGSTARTRIAKGRIIVTCHECGAVKRLLYKKNK